MIAALYSVVSSTRAPHLRALVDMHIPLIRLFYADDMYAVDILLQRSRSLWRPRRFRQNEMIHKNFDVSIIFDSILFISIAIVHISFVSMCVAAASERSFNRHPVKYWLMAHPLAHTAAITTPAAIPTVAASRLKRGCGLQCCFARMSLQL